MIESINYEKMNFIMNNFKFIKSFPNRIKKININSLEESSNLENIKGSNIITVNNLNYSLLLYKDNNKIYILNDDFEIKQNIEYPVTDKLSNFGQSCFFIEDYLSIIGLNSGHIVIYMYKLNSLDKFELSNKILLENFNSNFYAKYTNGKLILVQCMESNLVFYNFKFINDHLEKQNIVKMKISKSKIVLAFAGKYIFLNDSNYLYIIDFSSFKVIEKQKVNTINIESFKTVNDHLTFITESDKVTIYDDDLNVRQVIEVKNIDKIQCYDSYLLLCDSTTDIINIYALDENGIFVEFALFTSSEEISNVNYYNHKIILSENENVKYFSLPERIYDKSNLLGYGFYSDIDETRGRFVLLNNGRLSTDKLDVSLLIGYTDKISDIIVNNKTSNPVFKYSFHKDFKIDDTIKNNHIIITNNVKQSMSKLSKNTVNFIFVEEQNIELFLSSKKGSSISINIENSEKIISWPDNGVIKIDLINNTSIIQIKTNSNINVIGYKIKKDNTDFDYSVKIISNYCDVLVNDKILSNYQTFFPYVEENKLSGIITKKITDVDIEFDLIPISTHLSSYNSIDTLEFNKLNQQFSRKYLIENNDKSIRVTNLFSNKKIMEYKVKDLKGIRKILYVNPILIIFSKLENELDSYIHLVNSNTNKILPYVISNNSEENITDFFGFENNNLIFITNDKITNIIYIMNFDNCYEVSDVKKIMFKEEIKSMKIFENYLAIECVNKEIIIYDINECKAIISFKDENIIDFDLKYNILAVILNEEKPVVNVYEIKPDFQLTIKKQILEITCSSKIYIGPGRLVIENDKTYIYTFNRIIGIIKIDTIDQKLVHYYKNLLITENSIDFTLYKLSPNVNYTDNMIDCKIRLDQLIVKNKFEDRHVEVNILLKVNPQSYLKISKEEVIEFKKLCKNKCIAKVVLTLKNTEPVTICSTDKNIEFCGIIVGEFRDKLPCFLAGTLIDTPNGQLPIESLTENSVIYDDYGREVTIEKVQSWTTTNFTEGTIPYIISKDSLELDYPIEDLYVSPYHKIRLPNGDFVRVCDINLPFIKQFKNVSGVLKHKNKELNEITYYNFILPNNSNFIANGIPVESLDRSNPHIN